MAPMRAFSILQKWPKIAKMTPDDLLTLTMVSSEPLGKTEQNMLLVFKNSFFSADFVRTHILHHFGKWSQPNGKYGPTPTTPTTPTTTSKYSM